MIDAKAKQSRIETELRYLIGQSAPVVSRSGDDSPSATASVNTSTNMSSFQYPKAQLPKGPVVEKVRQVLLASITMEFVDTPLNDAIAYLKELHGIEIQLDEKALGDVGLGNDTKITIELKGIPLAAALQAIEDKYRPLVFVVRDYGILITTLDRVMKEGYFPAIEFARLSAGSEAFAPIKTIEKTFTLPVPIKPSSEQKNPKEMKPVRGEVKARGIAETRIAHLPAHRRKTPLHNE